MLLNAVVATTTIPMLSAALSRIHGHAFLRAPGGMLVGPSSLGWVPPEEVSRTTDAPVDVVGAAMVGSSEVVRRIRVGSSTSSARGGELRSAPGAWSRVPSRHAASRWPSGSKSSARGMSPKKSALSKRLISAVTAVSVLARRARSASAISAAVW
jgi:hypothetical protein